MSARGSRKGCKIAFLIFVLPILFILLYPSLIHCWVFINEQALRFKSQQSQIISIVEVYERNGYRCNVSAQVYRGEDSIAIYLYKHSPPGTYSGHVGRIRYYYGDDKETLYQEEIKRLEQSKGDLEKKYLTIIFSGAKKTPQWITFYFYYSTLAGFQTLNDPHFERGEASINQKIEARRIFEKLNIRDNPKLLDGFFATKTLFNMNNDTYHNLVTGGDMARFPLWGILALPGKWLCGYVIVPIIGFTPYYLLFIWPLALLVGAAVYIKRRLKRRYSLTTNH